MVDKRMKTITSYIIFIKTECILNIKIINRERSHHPSENKAKIIFIYLVKKITNHIHFEFDDQNLFYPE
jgi:hypothetical protein